VIALRADLKVVMAAHPVDFRKSVHTLSALVSEALRANPYLCVGRRYVAEPPRSA
jgi:transposase